MCPVECWLVLILDEYIMDGEGMKGRRRRQEKSLHLIFHWGVKINSKDRQF